MSEFITEPFQNLIDFQEGPGIMAKDFAKDGIPLIRLSGLSEGNSVLHGCNYLNPSKVANKWGHFILLKGDILLSSSASLGRIAVVDETAAGSIAYTGIIRMRPKDGRLFAPFIKYLLEGPDLQDQLEMMGVGSVIRHFGPIHLRQMSITFPPLPEQRRIAHVLGTLDDKIENNRKAAKTLEVMAQAIFKSWFVDFDPVRAKMAGESRESICKRLKLTPEILDLFPDRLVDSELGEIPEGWRVGTFGDYADIVGGSTPSTSNPDYWRSGLYSWATPKDLAGLKMPVLLATENKITEAGLQQISSRLLPVGTVLLSSRAPIGYLAITDIPIAINQGFIALKPHNCEDNIFLVLLIKNNMEEIISRANGSTFLEISKSKLRPIPVLHPDDMVRNIFAKVVLPLYRYIISLEKSNFFLSELRDTLLPELISGKFRIKHSDNTQKSEALKHDQDAVMSSQRKRHNIARGTI